MTATASSPSFRYQSLVNESRSVDRQLAANRRFGLIDERWITVVNLLTRNRPTAHERLETDVGQHVSKMVNQETEAYHSLIKTEY